MSVSAHRTENAVAITDALGRATVLRGDFFQNGGLAKEILHWHFLPAMAVCFSMQGNLFFLYPLVCNLSPLDIQQLFFIYMNNFLLYAKNKRDKIEYNGCSYHF